MIEMLPARSNRRRSPRSRDRAGLPMKYKQTYQQDLQRFTNHSAGSKKGSLRETIWS
jgi:hypothetical protein